MSNFITPISTDQLLSEAEKENLYVKLIEQLNKDFNFANEAVDFPKVPRPMNWRCNYTKKSIA